MNPLKALENKEHNIYLRRKNTSNSLERYTTSNSQFKCKYSPVYFTYRSTRSKQISLSFNLFVKIK